MKFFSALIFLIIFSVEALGRTNQLKGKFTLQSSDTIPVEFTLKWIEENGKISGDYEDNNYAKYAKVTGTSDRSGRQFKVTLPEANKGVLTISFVTSNMKPNKTGLEFPVAVITRDENGNPLTTRSLKAIYTTVSEKPRDLIVQKEEARPHCAERMGELTGFCGSYEGLIAEEVDATDSCNLLLADDFGLELDSERNLRLYLSSSDPLLNPPTHMLRRLPPNPKQGIDVTIRSCGTLAAVSFSKKAMSCITLNLIGSFSIYRGNKVFVGTYTIADEKTKNFCRYGLSLVEK